MAGLLRNITSLQDLEQRTAEAVDSNFLLYGALFIFLMQAGFGMLEVGAVRVKNTRNILLKNLLDTCIGACVWWVLGYTLAYGGEGAFVGTPSAPAYSAGEPGADAAFVEPGKNWLHQFMYASASATIVSGAVAERTTPYAYAAYSCVFMALIYPFIVHWAWSTHGWLSPKNDGAFLGGMIDFAGGGVVHLTGGTVALVRPPARPLPRCARPVAGVCGGLGSWAWGSGCGAGQLRGSSG